MVVRCAFLLLAAGFAGCVSPQGGQPQTMAQHLDRVTIQTETATVQNFLLQTAPDGRTVEEVKAAWDNEEFSYHTGRDRSTGEDFLWFERSAPLQRTGDSIVVTGMVAYANGVVTARHVESRADRPLVSWKRTWDAIKP